MSNNTVLSLSSFHKTESNQVEAGQSAVTTVISSRMNKTEKQKNNQSSQKEKDSPGTIRKESEVVIQSHAIPSQ